MTFSILAMAESYPIREYRVGGQSSVSRTTSRQPGTWRGCSRAGASVLQRNYGSQPTGDAHLLRTCFSQSPLRAAGGLSRALAGPEDRLKTLSFMWVLVVVLASLGTGGGNAVAPPETVDGADLVEVRVLRTGRSQRLGNGPEVPVPNAGWTVRGPDDPFILD